MRRLDLVAAAAIGALGVLAPGAAGAHFVLMTPANWAQQASGTGAPLKSAPCGQSDPGVTAVPTNVVTPFTAGQTITVTVDERTIWHPGHYRVALSTTGMSGLPADPPVTAGATPCGSTVIQSPPVYPVLADGMLVHTTRPTAVQPFQVKLPDNVTCSSNCVLQVIEFMSDHELNNPGGCFYHHCANITIAAATTGTGGAGGAAGTAGGGGGGGAGAAGGAAGRGGSGGAAGGSAGSTGLAGAAGNGAGGAAGAATGAAGNGVGGSAGVTGAAGAVAGSGGVTGVSGSSGGSVAGSGGSGSGGSPTGAAGAGMMPPEDDSGCACGLTGAGTDSGGATLLLLVGALAIARRRRAARMRRGATPPT